MGSWVLEYKIDNHFGEARFGPTSLVADLRKLPELNDYVKIMNIFEKVTTKYRYQRQEQLRVKLLLDKQQNLNKKRKKSP